MFFKLFALACLMASVVQGAAVSPLGDAGYSVLPPPQRVKLAGGAIRVGQDWKIQVDADLKRDDVAIETLKEEFSARHKVRFAEGAMAKGGTIRLTVTSGSVPIGAAQDRDGDSLAEQAYRIDIAENEVHITANAPPGLFYGVETLVQLARDSDGGVSLPLGEIIDWPDLQLRELYWDDAHHLERPEALRHAIRQAAFFKINGFVIKLEGHFQYRSAPAIVEPYALSPAELQELTDYATHYHVQLIPYLDAPAHIAFILKHPEYAALRAFPDCNYELCTTNPDSIKLLTGMFQDLLDANKGVKYFYLSTDEPYYLGKADDARFSEAGRMKELGSPGKLLAEFLSKTAGYLHDRGRTVVFWGEYPMKPADVAALPAWLVNGETDNGDFDAACKARGIRQTIYTSIEGEEMLFPDYALAPPADRLHPRDGGKQRVAAAIETVRAASARKNADLMGMLVAGWGDMGLHPETFWLGYASVAAAGWNPSTEADRAAADFHRLFYGPSAQNMDRIYTLMSTQAQFWSESWDSTPSTSRKGIWGSSNAIFRPRHPAQDQTLALPPAPAPADLSRRSKWPEENARRLELAEKYLAENDELLRLLHENIDRAEFNRYNLEVLISIAKLCRQNLQMLQDLSGIEATFAAARQRAADDHPAAAVAALDQAIDLARDIRRQRNEVLNSTTKTWYEALHPRVPEANGRQVLHELDDVKDHHPDRTVGMDYLVYREMNLPFGKWAAQVQEARNAYAKIHRLQPRTDSFDWSDTH